MKTLENEKDKIQKICDTLRYQTLEPAQAEAQKIVADAKAQAEQIIQGARQQADQMISDAKKSIAQEKNVFESSLTQATKQSIEALKQTLETSLFNPELHRLVVQSSTEPAVIGQLITAMVKAIGTEGLSGDISVAIPASVSAQQVSKHIAQEALSKIKDKALSVGDFAGGVKIRLEGKNITLDISNAEIEELIKRYVRKDFRKLLFGTGHHK